MSKYPWADAMSHIHHIDGSGNAAAEYQAYLERLRTRRRGQTDRPDAPLRTFDSAIDPDFNSEGERDGETEAEGEPEQGPRQEPESGPRYA